MNKILRKTVAPAALVAGLGVGATMMDVLHDPIPSLTAQTVQTPAPAANGLSTAFRAASQATLPGVVRVEVVMAPRAVSQEMRVPDELRGTPFEDFFGGPGGMQQAQPHAQMASGSGFIISPDGYILTNNHVVDNATSVKVTLTDKREFTAKVVGRDPNTDVAVIKIDGKDLPTVRLGNSDALEVGDWVLALGYPMQLGETVTAGIVSAKGKNIGIMQQNDEAQAPLEHFIQTDAAINPGNSGGPLIDLSGAVVGINTAIASETGTYSGYGFSVPIHLARRVADDLIRTGSVHRPKLGVQIQDVQPADKDVFKLPSTNGAVIKTTPQGPAQEAGLKLGDVIVAVNGTPIKDTGDLMERIALQHPGDRVRLDVIRYGQKEAVDVKLGEFATEAAARTAQSGTSEDAASRLGFEASPMTPQIAQQLHIKGDEDALVVTHVDPMGPAARTLAPGLRVDQVNGREIHSLSDLRSAAASLKDGATVSIVGRIPDGSKTIVNYRLNG
jgi:serine protease Do